MSIRGEIMEWIVSWILFIGEIFAFATRSDVEKLGNPLFLTPYIDTGRIEIARERAFVRHPQMKDTDSYAGFLTINKTFNSNTFFWYFPSQDDPKNDPLLLWMNGGPGSTSLFGLFNQNGPFIITESRTVEMRKYSWHKNHNIIYIDNPVGAGYSFTENNLGYARTQGDIGRDVLAALLQFFNLFPELRKNDFYVTGESYAGKYVPAVSYAIKEYNTNSELKINLKGLTIGNGLIDPINQMNYSDFMYNIGLFDSNDRKAVAAVEDEVRSLLEQKKYTEAIVVFDALFGRIYTSGQSVFNKITGYDYFYNHLQSARPKELKYYEDWITKVDVRNALHVGHSVFNVSSRMIREHFKEDILQSVAHYVADLVEDYKVLIYNGQLDIVVPYVSTENYLEHLDWSGASDFKIAPKKHWRVGEDIAGYSTSFKNLNLVLVRNAGHFLPTDQPLWAWDLMTRFTRDLEF